MRLLTLERREGARYVFAAEMGAPADVHEETIDAGGEHLTVSTLLDGQPAVRRPRPAAGRRAVCAARAGAGAASDAFPTARTSSSHLIERPDRVRIRIWERGVGPTESSGTGSCAAAVAAAAHGGAQRRVEVIAPGGSQIVRVDARRRRPDRLGRDHLRRDRSVQTFNQAMAAAEVYSPAEEQFNRRRRTVGSVARSADAGGALDRAAAACTPRRTVMAAILGMVVVLWVSEALPMAATAILGPVLAVVCQVADARVGAGAVRRSDHLPVHRQLHPRRSDVRPRRGPAHRLYRVVVAIRRAGARGASCWSTAALARQSRCGSATPPRPR